MSINYSIVLPFEKNFDPVPSTVWMQNNWYHSVTLSVLYVLAIFWGQKKMKHMHPYNLEGPLRLWNTLLAIFSLFGFVRLTPEFMYAVRVLGLEYSMCSSSYAQGVTGFWVELFAFSKVAEFGDTAFLVLRKRRVVFLHWYHHITVLVYTWHAYQEHCAGGRWFTWMNYGVHAFMYTYYALRSFGVRFPKHVPMTVTVMQLAQMVVGCAIALNVYRVKAWRGRFCQQTLGNLYFSFAIYFTYFLLFADFFFHAYLKSGNRYSASAVAAVKRGVDHHFTAQRDNAAPGDETPLTTNGGVRKRPVAAK